MKIAILGAGACGLMVGAYLSDKSFTNYVIFEKNKLPGRKILASGNGRCNISNLNLSNNFYHNADYFNYDRNALKDYLAENNLKTVSDDEGRIYPFSNSSQTILNFLLEKQKGKIFYDSLIKEVKYDGKKYNINGMIFDALVFATGSIANIDEKKQVGVYDYLKTINLPITDIYPSLVGFKIENPFKELNGIRVPVLASLYDYNSNLVHQENGEMIFKSDGISGIVIMNMSFYYNHLVKKENSYLKLKLYPTLTKKELDELLSKPEKLSYTINPKLWDFMKKFSDKNIKEFLLDLKLKIKGTYGFSDAQVISGGINVENLNPNFSVKCFNKLYAGGELLDVDGACGGYNLTFAFNSGIKIAQELLGEKNV